MVASGFCPPCEKWIAKVSSSYTAYAFDWTYGYVAAWARSGGPPADSVVQRRTYTKRLGGLLYNDN